MVGAVLQAAAENRVILVDGFITTSAVLVARACNLWSCSVVCSRTSRTEPVMSPCCAIWRPSPCCSSACDWVKAPGAALAWPLLASACAILCEMASFDGAGVSDSACGRRTVRGMLSGIPPFGPSDPPRTSAPMRFLIHEVRLFFIALQFFTRVPCPPGWATTPIGCRPANATFRWSVRWWGRPARWRSPPRRPSGLRSIGRAAVHGLHGLVDRRLSRRRLGGHTRALGGTVSRERALEIAEGFAHRLLRLARPDPAVGAQGCHPEFLATPLVGELDSAQQPHPSGSCWPGTMVA